MKRKKKTSTKHKQTNKGTKSSFFAFIANLSIYLSILAYSDLSNLLSLLSILQYIYIYIYIYRSVRSFVRSLITNLTQTIYICLCPPYIYMCVCVCVCVCMRVCVCVRGFVLINICFYKSLFSFIVLYFIVPSLAPTFFDWILFKMTFYSSSVSSSKEYDLIPSLHSPYFIIFDHLYFAFNWLMLVYSL